MIGGKRGIVEGGNTVKGTGPLMKVGKLAREGEF